MHLVDFYMRSHNPPKLCKLHRPRALQPELTTYQLNTGTGHPTSFQSAHQTYPIRLLLLLDSQRDLGASSYLSAS